MNIRIAIVVAMCLCAPELVMGSVASPMINTRRISTASPSHWVTVATTQINTAAGPNSSLVHLIYPHDTSGRLVDVIVYQYQTGTGGTSYTLDVRHSTTTSALSTLPVATLASGADIGTDARGTLALPSGWTRPVVKTTSDALFTKGERISIVCTETGSYSPHATIMVALVFEPIQ